MNQKKLTSTLVAAAILQGALCNAAELKNIVYVESNIATENGNSILAYQKDDTGKLMPLAGSPFLTQGKGVVDSSFGLGPFDSDQEIIANPERTLLFAVNSGSNTIAVFNIQADGSLKAVEGSPFASWGSDPVSLGLQGNVLTVVNKHQDPAQVQDQSLPNYTNFMVAADGKLTHIDNSTIEVAIGSSPTQALSVPGSGLIFGADFQGGMLQSFSLSPSSTLLQNSPLTLPAAEFKDINTPRLPLGLWANKTASVLYVGFVTANRLGVYDYNQMGALKFDRTVANSGKAICWLSGNRKDTRLYTSNSADYSISVYDIQTDPRMPAEIQNIVLKSDTANFQLGLNSDESALFVLSQRASSSIPQGQGNEIHWLSVDSQSGKLMEDPMSPLILNLPGDTRPQGILAF